MDRHFTHEQWILMVSAAVPWIYLALTFLIAAIYPGGYNQLAQPFSHLGAKTSRSGQNNVFGRFIFAMAIFMLIPAYPGFIQVSTKFFLANGANKKLMRYSRIGGKLSLLFLSLVAIFPTDPTLRSDPTFSGMIHDFSAMMFFLFFSVMLLISSRHLLQTGHIVIGLYGILIFAESIYYVFGVMSTYSPYYGLFQKIAVYGYIIWVSAISFWIFNQLDQNMVPERTPQNQKIIAKPPEITVADQIST